MTILSDFTILQRNKNGFGFGVIKGEYAVTDEQSIVVRVVNENNNQTVLGWQKAEVTNGTWQTELSIPTGGLYRIEARLIAGELNPQINLCDWGKAVKILKHIGVGDVFILAGQSNMSGYGRDFAQDAPQLGVHVMNNRGEWEIATHPLNTTVEPTFANNDDASGTSPGLSFGKAMANALHIPIGLLMCAQGGSSLESWNPAEDNCYLYHEMVKKVSLAGGAAAMVWYQGCNEAMDASEADTYYSCFSQSITLWRKQFGELPIVVCQLNRHAYTGGEPNDRLWGKVREAQRLAAVCIPHVYTVPTLDLYTTDGIHNSSGANVILGERIAMSLLYAEYGFPGSLAPNIKRIQKISPNCIQIYFHNPANLRTMDDLGVGMHIEDENGLQEVESVSVNGNGLLAKTKNTIGRNAVFHAYWQKQQPAFFVRDAYGYPMLACYGVLVEE